MKAFQIGGCRGRWLVYPLVVLSAASCGQTSPRGPVERTETSGQAIINGELDTTRQAVVRYQVNGSKCSATIFHVDGSTGYALSAAHCVDGGLGELLQGDDASMPDATYAAVEQVEHPAAFKAAAYDFGVIKFEGATAETPLIPLFPADQDTYVPGLLMDLVGYGETETGGTDMRYHVVNALSGVSATRFYFDQAEKGFCSGDSGGPGLTVNGGDRVAGVIQAVAPDCEGTGLAGRVSLVQDTFIWRYIEGLPAVPLTCAECYGAVQAGGSACIDAVIACFDNSNCESHMACLDRCEGDETCEQACAESNVPGATLYQAITACSCGACAEECTGEPICDIDPGTGGTGGAGGSFASGGDMGGDPGPSAPANSDDGGCSLVVAPSSGNDVGWFVLGLVWLGRRRRRSIAA